MRRGEVYFAEVNLPDRTRPGAIVPRKKLLVILQGDGPIFRTQDDVAVVVASTFRRPRPQAYEVLVGQPQGFDNPTVIDCRWVYTVPKVWFQGLRPIIVLGADVMEIVDEALIVGLDMNPN